MDRSTTWPNDEDEAVEVAPHGSASRPQPSPPFHTNNPFRQNVSQHVSPRPVSIASNVFRRPLFQQQQAPAVLERHKSLGDYFTMDEIPRTSYSDADFNSISRLLGETGRESWGRIPRIYTVLRRTGQIPKIESFLDQGMNDMWLPFEPSQLPHTMTADEKRRFIETQIMVLTKALDLENTSVKKHAHFKKGEEVPLDIGDKLGVGGYSNVYKAYSPLSGLTYALKMFRRSKADRGNVQSFMNEVQILKRINHHHCVELVASYTDSKHFGLLISPVADCNLAEFYIIVGKNEALRPILRTFFGCMAHALQYLHHQKIRHRDIKPENVLVKESEVYLTDFGISLDWENLSRSTTTADSAKSFIYCAPEVADYQKRNSSSDVWSLGCVFLEMVTILAGSSIEDLRNQMRENSGQPRFYQNSETAMEWVASLVGEESPHRDVLSWVAKMMVMEPTSRISSPDLCSLIVASSIGEEQAVSFCGDCCLPDCNAETSSDAGSDSVWAEAALNSPALNTPASSSIVTEHGSKARHSSGTSQASSLSALARLSEASRNLSIGQISDMAYLAGNSRRACSGDQDDALTVQRSYQNHVQESSKEGVELESLKIKDDSGDIIAPAEDAEGSSNSLAIVHPPTMPNLEIEENVKGGRAAENPAQNGPKLSEAKIRQAITERAKRDVRVWGVWPFVDLRNQIPKVPLSAWKTPSSFLEAVQSDVLFMERLRSIDPSHADRFKEATINDMFPVIYLLLVGGLDANAGYSVVRRGLSSRKEEKPLFRTLQPQWTQIRNCQHIPRLLLGFGAKVNILDAKYNSPLVLACTNGYMEVARDLLELDPKLAYEKDTAIAEACRGGNVELVDLLIRNGANFRFLTPLGCSLGTIAARCGHVEIVKLIVESGFGVNEWQAGSGCPRMLHAAIEKSRMEVVRYLLTQGANPTLRSGGKLGETHGTALDLAKKTKNTELINLINEACTAWSEHKKAWSFK